MYSTNNERRNRLKLRSKPFAISEYEHLEELMEAEERPGEVPNQHQKPVDHANFGATSAPRIWRTRRRRDGQVGLKVDHPNILELMLLRPLQIFLATEFVDNLGVMSEAKETLLRLLNHPNLVSLIDVVQDSDAGMTAKEYTVWEDCNQGSLNCRLWQGDHERL